MIPRHADRMLSRVLQAVWRRRFLIMVPLLVLLLASLLAAFLLPRTYTASALVLLQEGRGQSPLAREVPGLPRINEQVAGLEALLKSDLVLGNAVRTIAGPDTAADPRLLATTARDYREALSLDLVGSDFLAFQLRGNKPDGLGEELRVILSRFFEVLLLDAGELTAAELVVARRRVELETARTRLEELRQQQGTARAAANGTSPKALAGNSADRKDERGAGADAETTRPRQGPPGQTADGRSGVGGSAREDNRSHLPAVEAETQRSTGQTGDLARAVVAAEAELDRAQAEYESAAGRLSSFVQSRPAILNAPERIRIIDAPTDPLFPNRSRLVVLGYGIAASLLLAAGLAVAAELLDRTIRDPEEFAATSGVPVLAVLPRTTPVVMPTEQATTETKRRRPRPAQAAAVLILISLGLTFASSKGFRRAVHQVVEHLPI
jgi:capsular polysaccharide biosynthesis protein